MLYLRALFLVLLLTIAVSAQQENQADSLAFRRSLYGALNTGDAPKLATLIDRVDAKRLDELLLYSLSQNAKTPAEVVRLLLDKGANVNPQTNYKTPLMHAASEGNDKVIKLLLARGAQVNVRTDEGTPLMSAVVGGHTEAVKLLLASGADVKAVHRTGDQALIMAARQRSYRTPAMEPDSEIVRLLLAGGAEPNAIGDWGTALMSANTAAKVKLLVAGGANVETSDKEGETALMKAASSGDAAVVTALLESGANVNAANSKGMNALLFALDRENLVAGEERATLPERRIEVARRLLLVKGVQVNAQNRDGETALMRAVSLNNFELTKSLLDHGADANQSDVFGDTAFIRAYENDNAEIARVIPAPSLMLQPANVRNAFLRAAIGKKDEAKVRELLAAGADPNHEYGISYDHQSIKSTVLILAATMGDAEIVKLLLDKGANVNRQGLISGSEHGLKYGTALDAATNHPEVLAVLRKARQP